MTDPRFAEQSAWDIRSLGDDIRCDAAELIARIKRGEPTQDVEKRISKTLADAGKLLSAVGLALRGAKEVA